jgi:KUP system potassium uptake protein
MALLLSSIFILWRFGKEQQWHAESLDRFPMYPMLSSDNDEEEYSQTLCLTAPFGGSKVTVIRGMAIFLDKDGAGSTTPTAFVHFVQKFHATCEVAVFFHLRPISTPSVPCDERYSVTRWFVGAQGERKAAMRKCYRLTIRHGYIDEVITGDLGMLVFEQIHNCIIREAPENMRRKV